MPNDNIPFKKITLLLLRHGERADEAARYLGGSLGPRTRKDRMDPDLTEEGYRQAAEAFEKIVPYLRGKRVGVFTSPLKRTIATAAMIGMHAKNMEEGQDFVIPGGDESSTSIPLVVMNGLSDCAAHVQVAGGASAAVRDGYIDGAAMVANDCSSQSPIVKMVGSLPHLKYPIQFYQEDGVGFMAMTDPIGGSKQEEEVTLQQQVERFSPQLSASIQTNKLIRIETMSVARQARDDSFHQTLRRIVRLATAIDCEVCVVVTHREGIRDLAEKIRPGTRVSTPYCCIAKFSAQQQDDSTVHWEFHDVVQYQKFEP